MFTNLRSRIQKDEEGFTLVELMVVVLIMAILMAIAIPTFLGAQNKAKDSSAKADLRNAMTAAKSLSADQGGNFTTVTHGALTTSEPGIKFAAVGSKTAVGVYVGTAGADITLVKESKGGTFFAITSTEAGVTASCSSDDITVINTNAGCVGESDTTSWTS
jgi:type IV pilus assembly protein PilA